MFPLGQKTAISAAAAQLTADCLIALLANSTTMG
jgi:hypothetical protein